MGHADAHGALKLTLVDGNDTAAYYFCHICAGVDRNDDNAGRDERERISAACERISPVYNHSLNHHRSAAEYFDINGDDAAKQLAEESAHGIFGHGRGTQHTGQQTDKESGDRTYQ